MKAALSASFPALSVIKSVYFLRIPHVSSGFPIILYVYDTSGLPAITISLVSKVSFSIQYALNATDPSERNVTFPVPSITATLVSVLSHVTVPFVTALLI